MKRITYFGAVLYRLYQKQDLSIPHFRMLVTIAFVIFLHISFIGLLFNIPSTWLFPWNPKDKKIFQWYGAGIYFGLLITIINLVFSKTKLDKIEVSTKSIDRAKKRLPVYFILLLVILTILLIRHGVTMGKIKF